MVGGGDFAPSLTRGRGLEPFFFLVVSKCKVTPATRGACCRDVAEIGLQVDFWSAYKINIRVFDLGPQLSSV